MHFALRQYPCYCPWTMLCLVDVCTIVAVLEVIIFLSDGGICGSVSENPCHKTESWHLYWSPKEGITGSVLG